jgi:hypothetical protein
VVLKLLTKAVTLEKERLFRGSAFTLRGGSLLDSDDYISVEGYLKEVMKVMPNLNHVVTAPLQDFFASVKVDGNTRYYEDRDSFALHVKLRYLLADDLEIDCAKARMAPVTGGQGRDLWLETEDPVHLKKGIIKMQLQGNVS